MPAEDPLVMEKTVDTRSVPRDEDRQGPNGKPGPEAAGAWWKVAGIFFLFFNIW